jgi:long-chain acyl-CoA synthetase
MSNGENIYPEAIEHKMNAIPWIVESLVLENNGQLDAWVYPDQEYVDAATVGQSQAQRQEYIKGLLAETRAGINEKLSPASRLTRVLERREPFVKTATHKIKRYLYNGKAML